MTAPSVDLSALDALAEAATAEETVAKACDALLDDFVKRAEKSMRKVSEAVYEELLYMVQDYLKQNAHWNLANDIERCNRIERESLALKAEIEALRGENEVLREEGMTTEAMCAIAAAFAYEHAARAIEAQATTCADIALEGGDRARANESMEAALTVAARMVRALKSKPTPAVPEEALNMVIDAHVARLRAALGATS